MTAPRRRPEKHLERQVLRAVGRHPDLLVAVNTVGVMYRPAALFALQAALAPFGQAAVRTAVDALSRHRVTVGLGTGSPDLVGCYRGRAFGWELKTEVGRLSDDQERWHAAARRRGLLVEVVRSPGDALEALRRMGR